MSDTTPEQEARDILERMGVDDAQALSSGDVVELANLIAEVRKMRKLDRYEVGYRDGESNRAADAQIYHEEVLDHDGYCRCPLGSFLAHVGVY